MLIQLEPEVLTVFSRWRLHLFKFNENHASVKAMNYKSVLGPDSY